MKQLRIIAGFMLAGLLLQNIARANSAMPGYWNTGAAHTFVPFFPEDSVWFGKVRMEKEQVSVLLGKGYAVVKGQYWMRSLADSVITLRTGYPINGVAPHKQFEHFMFDDLYALKVFVNGVPAEVKKISAEESGREQAGDDPMGRASNWYYWQSTYLPDTLNLVTVYFIVETNFAHLSKGYNKLSGCAFAYVLHSGRAWAGTIGEGQIRILMKDGLQLDDVKGIWPDGIFLSDGSARLLYSFRDLEPEGGNNILIRYAEPQADFSIEKITGAAAQLFEGVDAFSSEAIEASAYRPIHKNDFDIPQTAEKLFLGIAIGVIVAALAFLGLIAFVIYRLFFRKKKNT